MSEDIEVIKGARSTAKGKVTKKINYLKKILRCDKDGKFITAELDEDSVQETMAELRASYECFQDLDDRVLTFMEKQDKAADISLETSYENGVTDEYTAAVTLHFKYKNAVKAMEEAKVLSAKVDMLKLVYDGKYSAAKTVVSRRGWDCGWRLVAGAGWCSGSGAGAAAEASWGCSCG